MVATFRELGGMAQHKSSKVELRLFFLDCVPLTSHVKSRNIFHGRDTRCKTKSALQCRYPFDQSRQLRVHDILFVLQEGHYATKMVATFHELGGMAQHESSE